MPRVHLPDGRIVNFPYDMSTEAIQAAVANLTTPRSLGQRAVEDFGLPETAGGLAGGALGTALAGPVGTIPGAMLGAGGVRYIRGRMTGETAAEATIPALGNAALEALPGIGKGMRFVGKRMIRSALPITEKAALELGRGSAARGVETLVSRAEALPGIRLSKTARLVGEAPRAGQAGTGRLGELATLRAAEIERATGAGRRVATAPIVEAGEALTQPGGVLRRAIGEPEVSGAQRVVKRFRGQVSKERPMTADELRGAVSSGAVRAPGFAPTVKELADLTPADADALLRHTKFFRGAREVPGAETAGRTLRTALSSELKTAVPKIRPLMAEQASLIPVQRSLDRALAKGGSQVRAPAVYLSGGRPRLFGVLPSTPAISFTTGKALSRLGGPLGAAQFAQRTIPPAIRALLLQLASQDENAPY